MDTCPLPRYGKLDCWDFMSLLPGDTATVFVCMTDGWVLLEKVIKEFFLSESSAPCRRACVRASKQGWEYGLSLPLAHLSALCSVMLGLGLCKTLFSFVTWLMSVQDARGSLEDGTREETCAPSSACCNSQNWSFVPGGLPELVEHLPHTGLSSGSTGILPQGRRSGPPASGLHLSFKKSFFYVPEQSAQSHNPRGTTSLLLEVSY